ncbi:MAG: FAD-dependent oxidoreductase [Pirellulales bacterium]
MTRKSKRPFVAANHSLALVLACAIHLLSGALARAEDDFYDVVIYGGNAAGVAAAVQADRMGKSVVLIEPSRHIGGLTSGGLGATDIGNKSAIGGISREFYRRVKRYYEDAAAWKQQRRDDYRSPRQAAGEDTMWTFEPHVAEKILRNMLAETKAVVVYGERLDRRKNGPGVLKHNDARIVYITMESGRKFSGRRYLDCTYEGDLMAAAGVSYTVGREANATYGETLNGVQTAHAKEHQLQPGIDPYVRPGDKASGLLPGIDPNGPGEEGGADRRVQAYCLRMCVTDAAENRLPWTKPADYDPLQYELLLRNFEAGETRAPWSPTMMPNRKTDTNNNYGFSTDFLGASYGWPDGDYATRQRLYREHLSYQQGLMWTLSNDPRVPEKIRRKVSRWGPAKDEFADNGGWSHQLYVREARRMIGQYVMTQHDCQGRRKVEDSIGLAAYTMDSHNVQRHLDANGHVRNEGDVQVGGFGPYPIAYRSIVPKQRECDNLLVPVCMSASHIAYGSIRMEPVFMVLGQSAATAACQSIDAGADVQDVDMAALQKRLRNDGQVLEASRKRGGD